MPSLHTPQPLSTLAERWPASIHPDHAERAYYPQRGASRTWVRGLRTRSGLDRWERVRRCGDPVAVLRMGERTCAWQHKWCRDRACYACARSRSRRIATTIRSAVESRSDAPLFFVTLTMPKSPGSPAVGIESWHKAWRALRKCAEFRAVVGGVRAQETTWSTGHARAARRFAGWHTHGHLIFELDDAGDDVDCAACNGRGRRGGRRCATCSSSTVQGDGTMPAALRALVLAWCRVSGGSIEAQCAVKLTLANAGQLAKYVSKLWDLPADRAPELFAALHGRRIVEGFGEWRKLTQWGAVERTPAAWIASGVPIREIEKMHPDDRVAFGVWDPRGAVFRTPMTGLGRLRTLPKAARDDEPAPKGKRRRRRVTRLEPSTAERVFVPVAHVRAGDVLAAITRDPRPAWEHDGATPAEVETYKRLRALCRQRARNIAPCNSEHGQSRTLWVVPPDTPPPE